jgi:hypothetical protein
MFMKAPYKVKLPKRTPDAPPFWERVDWFSILLYAVVALAFIGFAATVVALVFQVIHLVQLAISWVSEHSGQIKAGAIVLVGLWLLTFLKRKCPGLHCGGCRG